MTGLEFADAMEAAGIRLDLAPTFFGVHASTVRRWRDRGPPDLAETVVEFLIHTRTTPEAFVAAACGVPCNPATQP